MDRYCLSSIRKSGEPVKTVFSCKEKQMTNFSHKLGYLEFDSSQLLLCLNALFKDTYYFHLYVLPCLGGVACYSHSYWLILPKWLIDLKALYLHFMQE